MRVYYNAPELPHPGSRDITVVELAQILESKYKLLERFTKAVEPKFMAYLRKIINRGHKGLNLAQINEFFKSEWREYILDGAHGIMTEAARERGDPSFVDTSAYYLGITPEVEFSKEELQALNALLRYKL